MLPYAFLSRDVFRHLLGGGCLLFGCLFTALVTADEYVVELTAGKHSLPPSPVQFDVPADLLNAEQLQLRDDENGKLSPVQFNGTVKGNKRSALFILQEELKPGKTRQYTLSKADTSAANAPPYAMTVIDKQGGRIALKLGDAVLRYNAELCMPPENVAAHYRSSGHIHPVRAPNGEPVTSEFPADHLHQHALFGAWVKTTFKDRKVDFWNQGKNTGRVQHHKFGAQPVQGAAYCQFTAIRRHIAMDVTPPEQVLEEAWRVTVYNTPDYQLFDIETHQQLAPGVKVPLQISKYHYGGMAIRGRDEWLPGSVRLFSNAAGDRLEGNAKPAHWVAMEGDLKEGRGGIAMLSHRGNFRAPQPVRLHPKMPYFCFMPAVNKPFVIAVDKPFHSRYRYCVFNGKVDAASVEALSRNYADQPDFKISIRPVSEAKPGK